MGKRRKHPADPLGGKAAYRPEVGFASVGMDSPPFAVGTALAYFSNAPVTRAHAREAPPSEARSQSDAPLHARGTDDAHARAGSLLSVRSPAAPIQIDWMALTQNTVRERP